MLRRNPAAGFSQGKARTIQAIVLLSPPMHQKMPIVAIKVTLFVVLAVLGHWLFAWMLLPLGLMAASALGVFLAASVATALVMRIYEQRGIASAGLAWNAASARNLSL
ncbi:MAG: hypothetical protein ABSG25_03625, partial [Bryobacteraceae bacterium]